MESYRFTPLAASTELEAFPSWSPDNKTVAYSAESGGVMQVFTRRAGNGAPARVTQSQTDGILPFWSADGRRIYYISSSNRQPALSQVGAAGGAAGLVLGNVAQAALSTDGRTLALLRKEGAGYTLWFSTPPGSLPYRYIRLKPVERWSWVAFAPGEKDLGLWAALPGGQSKFWRVPVNGEPDPALKDLAGVGARRFGWLGQDRLVYS
jgi:hypothetical protein